MAQQGTLDDSVTVSELLAELGQTLEAGFSSVVRSGELFSPNVYLGPGPDRVNTKHVSLGTLSGIPLSEYCSVTLRLTGL